MAVFITSKAQARRHGVYAIEKTPPAVISATGTGTVALVEQFPWGPQQALTYTGDFSTMVNMFAPPGMTRTGTGYTSLIRKSFTRLGIIRVTNTASALAASAIMPNGSAVTIVTTTLKYVGAAGNACTWTVANATDGNVNHFDLTVTVSGASGVTTETIRNLNVSGVGADALPTASDYAKLYLVGAVAKNATGRPVNGSGSFSAGADGTIISSDWVGTAGTADKGIALCESDKTVDFVMAGDPGNSIRAAVNAGLQAHVDLMTDRMAVINGPSGQTAAQAQTDVASYRSQRVIYVDPWVYILDDVDGTKRLVPPASFAASACSIMPPSTSIAWKSIEAQRLLQGIADVEAGRGNLAADNTDAGIVTVTQEDTGGWTFESAKNTYHPTDPTRGSIKRTRMGHYIARSITKSLRPYTDSPNVPFNQQDEIEAVQEFLFNLAAAAKIDPNHLIHIAGFDMPDPTTLNPQVELDAGQFTIGANVKISSDQEKIFFLFNYGETVKPVVSL